MIAVIFELEPAIGREQEYFDLASDLRPLLDDIDGFISIERFESLTTSGKYLSLSFWRDDDAVLQWRNLSEHRAAQTKGRKHILSHYRLRVASVARDYSLADRSDVPTDSLAFHS